MNDKPATPPTTELEGDLSHMLSLSIAENAELKAEIGRLHSALEALTERAFNRCLFPREVKTALKVLYERKPPGTSQHRAA